MEHQMSLIEVIILLAAVVFIYVRLRSVLGTRPDNSLSPEQASKIFDLIVNEAKKDSAKTTVAEKEAAPEEPLSELDRALRKIPNFNKDNFLNGAKKAFEMILGAFSKGDMATLEMLANKNLVKKFQDIIEQRKNDGVTSETDLIGFDNAEILDAKISKNDVAKITVQFISEQINILRDAKSKILEGDENYIQKITDKWTFERSITSTNPNWLLVSTKK